MDFDGPLYLASGLLPHPRIFRPPFSACSCICEGLHAESGGVAWRCHHGGICRRPVRCKISKGVFEAVRLTSESSQLCKGD
jgi:hypothetical protein